jgi:predicted phage terminase large subunit-like protein
MKNKKLIEDSLVSKMMKDKLVRTSITKSSFLFFFHFYYAHYVKYETADFQKEIIHNLEKSDTENLYVVAFRGSGKSTMVTTAYPVWAILGEQQKKFCVIFCQTMLQAKKHMANLRNELESNDLLKKDLGPFQEESDEWGSYSLVFNKHNARITVASTEQSIRGLRHNEYRPDLLICDDVEDIQSTKTREGRDKTYNWLRGEVMPTGDKNTRLIIVGNLLHEDSLLMRIKEEIIANKARGLFKEYPLLDNQNNCLWPGKYTCEKDIEDEKMKVANEISWQREYLLRIVPTDDQAIRREWLQFYDDIPVDKRDSTGYSLDCGTVISVDLAISQSEAADYTAMVIGRLIGDGSDTIIYILPNPINRKISFPETVDLCKVLYKSHTDGRYPTFIIEDVAYQRALPQQLQNEGIYNVRTVRPGNQDKRSRLVLTAHMIQSGKVLFPKQGAEDLINQIVHFGVEKYDDLADAFSALVLSIIEKPPVIPRVTWINF